MRNALMQHNWLQSRHPDSSDRYWRRYIARLALVALLLVGIGALAQVLAPTQPPSYCSPLGCFPSLDQAESAMRAQTLYQGAGHLLEHMQTVPMSPTTVRLQYWLRDRPADLVRTPSYFANYGLQGTSQGACTLGDDQGALPSWCANVDALVTLAEERFRAAWPGCTITGTVRYDDFDINPDISGSISTPTRGIADYNLAWFRTSATCPTGSRSSQWSVAKKQPYYCTTGFGAAPIFDLTEATLHTRNVCTADNDDVAYINAPIQQCGSCAGSPHPIFPATGEKQHQAIDFSFAGTAFTRTYRSLRQFRTHRNFAIAWSHSWTDRMVGDGSAGFPYAHISETGDYESFALLAGTRYRGENSADRVLERVNAGGIGWRLRFSDGETREFDLAGYLIAVRHADDPRRDMTITYTDKAIASISDAQGRTLRFEHAGNMLRRIVLPDGSAVSYGYDPQLNLTTVTYPGGAVRHYHYAESGLAGAADQRHQLTGITGEDGQRYASFGYDARGRATSSRVHGTPNELTTVSYTTEDSAALITASGGTDSYVIQPGVYRRILNLSDGSNAQSHSYDAQGRLSSKIDERGIRTDFGYQDAFLAAIVQAVGTPEEVRTEIDHDTQTGRMTEARVRNQVGTLLARSTASYNLRGQPITIARIDPSNGQSRTVTFSYCEDPDVTSGLCPSLGLLKTIDGSRIDAPDTVTFSYRLTDEASCQSAPLTCPYRKGDLWKTTNALGQVTEVLRYDGNGQVLSTRDATGVITDLERDARGRVLRSIVRGNNDASDADDRITHIAYNPTGSVQRVTMPDGSVTHFSYDNAQRLTAITDATGNRISYTLDAAGNRTKEETRDASGVLVRTLSATYDALGRLGARIDAYQHSTLVAYNAAHQPTLITDALGRRKSHDYDALGRLRSSIEDVDGIAAQTRYRYDALDRLIGVTDPSGLHTTYTYNAFGDVLSQTSPDTGTTNASYDSAGNARTRTSARGITETTAYDALNRPTHISYPDSSRNVSYTYDSASVDCQIGERFLQGRLAGMTDASGSTQYCFDRYGQLARKLQTTAGRTFTLRYLHTDPKGRLPGQDYALVNPPPGNQLIGYTYPDGTGIRIVRDSNARPIELRVTQGGSNQTTTLLHNATYYPFGDASQWTFGNGRIMRRSRNQNYEPGFVEDTAPSGISEGYEFDAVGNLTSLRHAQQLDPPKRTFRYDGLNRLTDVRDGGTNIALQSYAYDKTGNRTRKTENGIDTLYSYTPGSHHLAFVGSVARLYDASGNTVRIDAAGDSGEESPPDPGTGNPGNPGGNPQAQSTFFAGNAIGVQGASIITRDFGYDDANRLRWVARNGVMTRHYLYNGKGELVYKVGGGIAVTSIYDEAGHWIGDYDASGLPIQQAIWLGDIPVGLLVGAGINQKLYYIEADALGSPRVLIDPIRNVAIWRFDLTGEAFGDTYPDEDPDGDGQAFTFDMRFPGQRYDSATGFNYNYFRNYDPETGRYVESDPIGLSGGVSTYGYGSANPLRFADPLGLQAIPIPGVIPPPVYIPGTPIDPSLDTRQPLLDSLERLYERTFEDDIRDKTYQTYTRYNPFTGQCYSGRTSGYGTPEQNVKTRGLQQADLTAEGFNLPVLDRSSKNKLSIRGREQQLIEMNGGAQIVGGTSRNLINGISIFNPNKQDYMNAATLEFGLPVKADMKYCQCR